MMNLKKILDYNKETGVFIWKVGCNRHPKGSLAGTVNQGYVRIKIKGRTYAAHRLAWFLSFNRWPKNEIDHINRNRSDNRLCNLREASRSQNTINTTPCKNSCGYKGVTLKPHGQYQARIVVNGKAIYLGHYSSPEEAGKAYSKAALLHHGEFANLNHCHSHRRFQMARTTSTVVSPADKKAALKEAKQVLKDVQASAKKLAAEAKIVAKARAAEDKAHAKLVAESEKAVAKATKAVEALSA